MKEKRVKWEWINRIENVTIVRVVRSGLVNMIPVLIIGAFALILMTFPVEAYQNFLKTAVGSVFLEFFNMVYGATFGVLSLYMTFSISRSYMKLKADPDAVNAGAIISSLLSFFILTGANLSTFGTDNLGPKNVFLAILTGFGASYLYLTFSRLFRKAHRTLYSRGADREFNRMLSTLLPIILVTAIFAVFNLLVNRIFHVESFRELLANLFNKLFSIGETGFAKGFFFVFLSSVLWFFGIHGSDTLEGVMQTYFTPGLAANQAAVQAGNAPTTILTKEFFDCFVLMGGCGAAICLLIVILLFSKNRARRGLGYAAAFPMIFNINELMVFGLPIILNPVMLIPFLLVPLACYSVTYLAISTGIVPMITSEVAWTTPIILGGYTATGSVAGAILQVVNVVIGVLIYLPFVRILDRQALERGRQDFDEFMAYYRKNEADLVNKSVLTLPGANGGMAKELAADIRAGLKSRLKLAYQPQYNFEGQPVGVEALLRFRHEEFGVLYPPLVVKLAEEGGFLEEMEEAIFARALSERPAILKKFGEDVKISINVTGTTVVTQSYLQFCRRMNEKYGFAGKNICLELTEQAALSLNEDALHILSALHEIGLQLAIDDFSMGQTSLHYLKDTLFDIVKLDGSLVQGLFTHENGREIVSSIVGLANSLNISVIAEFVEKPEERDFLHSVGCNCYQGYLYSPAVYLEEGKEGKTGQ